MLVERTHARADFQRRANDNFSDCFVKIGNLVIAVGLSGQFALPSQPQKHVPDWLEGGQEDCAQRVSVQYLSTMLDVLTIISYRAFQVMGHSHVSYCGSRKE